MANSTGDGVCCENFREREEGRHAVNVCPGNCIQVHNVRVRIFANMNALHVVPNACPPSRMAVYSYNVADDKSGDVRSHSTVMYIAYR